ncbi:MAG: TetR family transcriptional regulator [Cellvibrionaceae bacterium]|nr:TetR family transcriptional regulator [Cellvibrionaceae bacterium]|tara:strand:+ start:3967 stop:4638 length:672 start_codon:yes stop_codon:yes gene_type:complete
MAATRKKSTRQSREVRTQAILEAARNVFEEQGYENAKVSDIAESVGVVEGTVFSYFSSKRMLVLKVMEQFYDEITEVIEGGIKAVEGTRNRLHYVIWNHLTIVSRNRALCGVILRESRGLDKALSKEVHNLNRRYTNIVSDVLNEGIALGDVREDTSPTLVRNALFGTIEHYLWDLISGVPEFDIDVVAQQLTDLVFTGIAVGHGNSSEREVVQLIKKLNKML